MYCRSKNVKYGDKLSSVINLKDDSTDEAVTPAYKMYSVRQYKGIHNKNFRWKWMEFVKSRDSMSILVPILYLFYIILFLFEDQRNSS